MKHHESPSQNTTARRAAHLAFGIGAAVLLAAAPQLVRADTTSATSVDLQAVSVSPDSTTTDAPEIGLVRVVFQNTSTVAAREVDFQVIGQSGALLQQINDKGNFAPGTRIAHTFVVPGVQENDAVQVAVVKYADGTMWTANDAHLEGENQQSVLSTGSAVNPFAGR